MTPLKFIVMFINRFCLSRLAPQIFCSFYSFLLTFHVIFQLFQKVHQGSPLPLGHVLLFKLPKPLGWFTVSLKRTWHHPLPRPGAHLRRLHQEASEELLFTRIEEVLLRRQPNVSNPLLSMEESFCSLLSLHPDWGMLYSWWSGLSGLKGKISESAQKHVKIKYRVYPVISNCFSI